MTKETKNAPLINPEDLRGPGQGYTEVSGGDRVQGFFLLAAGNAIAGVFKGSFEVNSKFARGDDGKKKKRVYRVEVTSIDPAGRGPTLFMPADSAVAEEYPDGAEAELGDLIGIDEKGFLQSLRSLQDGQEVWIACLGKEPPSDEFPQGAWKFKVMAKPLDAPAE